MKKQLKSVPCAVANKKDFPWRSRIVWTSDSKFHWNEICAQVIEQFGLPGDRYFADVGLLNMTVIFRNPQDLLLFKLKWSEYEL
jgi:hypothetical protein